MMLTPNQTARKAITRPSRKGAHKRQGRNLRCRIGIAAIERQEAALHESETDRRGHRAGYRCRSPDHRRHAMLMGHQMR